MKNGTIINIASNITEIAINPVIKYDLNNIAPINAAINATIPKSIDVINTTKSKSRSILQKLPDTNFELFLRDFRTWPPHSISISKKMLYLNNTIDTTARARRRRAETKAENLYVDDTSSKICDPAVNKTDPKK
ncbi:hypothetical protein AGMMS49592_3530 [Endomicrobiia bacterium]|nr:hypothetical protein AGMMS49592_3530 [Endomicrobiia bacterium]